MGLIDGIFGRKDKGQVITDDPKTWPATPARMIVKSKDSPYYGMLVEVIEVDKTGMARCEIARMHLKPDTFTTHIRNLAKWKDGLW